MQHNGLLITIAVLVAIVLMLVILAEHVSFH